MTNVDITLDLFKRISQEKKSAKARLNDFWMLEQKLNEFKLQLEEQVSAQETKEFPAHKR